MADVGGRLGGHVARAEPRAAGDAHHGDLVFVGERREQRGDPWSLVGYHLASDHREAVLDQQVGDGSSGSVVTVTAGHPVASGDDRRRPSTSHLTPPASEPLAEDRQSVVAVILAAGRATRFGTTKQVAELQGRPMVGHVVATALASSLVEQVLVVVGHDAGVVSAAVAGSGPVEVVDNPVHATGQASSVRAGVAAARRRGASAVVVLLADEPDVTAQAVDAVVGAVRDGAPASRARYEDGPGHPVAFAARVFDRLLGLDGDRGARDLLAELGVVAVPVPGPRPRDLDRPEDLAERDHR